MLEFAYYSYRISQQEWDTSNRIFIMQCNIIIITIIIIVVIITLSLWHFTCPLLFSLVSHQTLLSTPKSYVLFRFIYGCFQTEINNKIFINLVKFYFLLTL